LIARDMTTLLSLILGARRHRDARDNFVRDIPKTVPPPKTEAAKNSDQFDPATKN
jgi:hypothetical protein